METCNGATYPLDVAGEARTTGKLTTSELSLTGNNAVIYGANINSVGGIYYNSGSTQGHNFSIKIGGVVSYPFSILGTQLTAGSGVGLSVPGTSYFGNVKINTVAASVYCIDLVGSQRTTGDAIIVGKLGVNTTTPVYPVDVVGDMRVSANLYTTGNLVSTNASIGNNTLGALTNRLTNGLTLSGTTASIAGPHIQAYNTTDNYPSFQQLNWQHDNTAMNFDAYWNGSSWLAAHTTVAYQIYKIGGVLNFNYAPSATVGTAMTFSPTMAIVQNQVMLNATSSTYQFTIKGYAAQDALMSISKNGATLPTMSVYGAGVGIGLALPSYPLHVSGYATGTGIGSPGNYFGASSG